jgi:phage/plasmid-like protein (TIGR03299 family)
MAHELDRNARTGKLAMFSVKLSPWHREGVILNEAPELADAMALAGSDYEVGLRPLFIQTPEGAGFIRTEAGVAIVRLDRNEALGFATEKYGVLQNSEAFGVLQPLLDSGLATLETGGTLRGGQDAWMMAKFAIKDALVREVFKDEVVPFALITNNHTRRKMASVALTPVRVVCANTLAAAEAAMNLSNCIRVRHSSEARIKVVEAAQELFANLTARYHTLAESFAILKANRLTVDQFIDSVLNTVSPLPEGGLDKSASGHAKAGWQRTFDRAVARRERITSLWETGDGHTGDHSAWEAYNAAVQSIDHDEDQFVVTGSRVEALTSGRLGNLKTDVLTSIFATIRAAK